VISLPISLLISQLLSSGSVPLELKTAAVTPVLKKHGLDPTNMANFRPISNLPFLSKLLEKVVSAQLQTHLSANNHYECFQSAFRTLHSTETALLRVVNDLLLATDSGSTSILILLDISSAFDTISHNILISRLSAIGVSGTALTWFTSYLSDRQHYISIRQAKSTTLSVPHGVPQGSVLGPLLFIIYMLPLGNIIRHHGFKFHCYADDTQLYIHSQCNSPFPTNSISACIDDLNAWMTSNFLKLNTDKTDLLLIGSPRITPRFCVDNVHIAGVSVQPSTTVKNLGIIFDSSLSFLPHISSLTKSAFFHLRNIARLRPFLNITDAETLVHAFITSRLDYCNSLFYGLPDSSINKLQYIQNSAARVLTYTKKSSHITPILRRLHWLPVRFRINYKILLITFKALHGLAPPYISDLIHTYSPARTLRSSDTGLLRIPRHKLSSFGGRAFCTAAPTLWNSIPQDIRDLSTLHEFKTHLKTYLFASCFC